MSINWSPSLMLVDILHLEDQLEQLTKAGCTTFHIDVMDGNYVPNITLGMMDILALDKITKLPLEVHLMVNEPSNILHLFNLKNVSTLMIHPEVCTHLHRTLTQIKTMGKRVGLVVNPSTPLSYVEEVIDELDVVMVMAVNPGYAGQAFIPTSFKKIERLRALLTSYRKDIEIIVDGSISTKNIKQLVDCGANGFVLGSAGLFREDFDFKRNLYALIDASK
jgi:ribulose-phosphate 3-epimerase